MSFFQIKKNRFCGVLFVLFFFFMFGIHVHAQEVQILWQAHSYTPPFYKGKALSSSEGLLVLTAISEADDSDQIIINPNNLTYTWSQDGFTLGHLSGFGKKRIILSNRVIAGDKTRISVVASFPNKDYEIKKTIEISVYEPKILFFEKHPLNGILFNKALIDSIPFLSDEITIKTEPFFFSINDLQEGKLDFRWSLNDRTIEAGQKEGEITLRKEGNENGIARLDLRIRNFGSVLQEAINTIFFNFGL